MNDTYCENLTRNTQIVGGSSYELIRESSTYFFFFFKIARSSWSITGIILAPEIKVNLNRREYNIVYESEFLQSLAISFTGNFLRLYILSSIFHKTEIMYSRASTTVRNYNKNYPIDERITYDRILRFLQSRL